MPSGAKWRPGADHQLLRITTFHQNGGRVAWKYYKETESRTTSMHSRYYDDLKREDRRRYECEETRILYVAATRTKHKLIMYVDPRTKTGEPASHILEGLR